MATPKYKVFCRNTPHDLWRLYTVRSKKKDAEGEARWLRKNFKYETYVQSTRQKYSKSVRARMREHGWYRTENCACYCYGKAEVWVSADGLSAVMVDGSKSLPYRYFWSFPDDPIWMPSKTGPKSPEQALLMALDELGVSIPARVKLAQSLPERKNL